MIGYLVSYMTLVLVLAVIKAAIEDCCRDHRLAYVLCGALIIALVVFR